MGGRLYRRKDFSVGVYNPLKGKRLSPAWLAMEDVMLSAGDGWTSRDELVEAGLAASDLAKVTVQGMLAKLSAPDGPLERKGSIRTRRYRLRVE